MRPEALIGLFIIGTSALYFEGTNGIVLSSSVKSEEGHVIVCPDTNIIFTCSDIGVYGMGWLALPLLNNDNSPGLGPDIEIGVPLVVEDVFIITLVARELMDDFRGNYTSTLNVVVNDTIQNGTNVTCKTPTNSTFLFIFKGGPPLTPMIEEHITGYSVENFTICFMWQRQKLDLHYLINTSSGIRYNETLNTLCLIVEYNTPLQLSLEAVNCAGKSEPATTNISVALTSAGCGSPSPPVNGSVGEWTSSRVGAQVTYSCDTHLVLVGETVATCSLPSLTWLPSSDDVMCVPLPSVISSPSIQSSSTSTTTVPSNAPTSASESTSIAVSVAVPLVILGILVVIFIFIVLVGVSYRHRWNRWKVSRVVEDNCYDGQDMLMRPGSSTGTVSLSTSHSPPLHSPLTSPYYGVPSGGDVPLYHDVDRAAESSNNGTTSSTVLYSETSTSARRVVASHDSHGVVTSHQSTHQAQYSTVGGSRDTTSSHMAPLQEKYAQLAFEETLRLPSLENLDQPVKYSEVRTSNQPHPQPSRPDPHEPCDNSQSSGALGGDKHPLDKSMTIDMVIQQLQQLTPHWWAVGEAAGLQRPTLKEIMAHYKGNEKESFVEVMNQIFIPGQTTWTQLAGVCDRAGFTDLATALLDSYTAGVLPVKMEEDKDTLRRPPTEPTPPLPPRGTLEDEDEDLPPSLPPPIAPEDVPPSLPPPLAPEDIPPALPPPLPPSDDVPPPRPPKASKAPAIPPRH